MIRCGFLSTPDREQMIDEYMFVPEPGSLDARGALSETVGMFRDKYMESDGVAASMNTYNHMIHMFDEINEQTGYRFEEELIDLFEVYRNQILATLSRHYFGFNSPQSKIENEMLHELNYEINAQIDREISEILDATNNEIERYGKE